MKHPHIVLTTLFLSVIIMVFDYNRLEFTTTMIWLLLSSLLHLDSHNALLLIINKAISADDCFTLSQYYYSLYHLNTRVYTMSI
eukprot:g3288.t1